ELSVMKRNLLYKSIFIVAVVLLCLLAITGIPNGVSWQAWKQSTRDHIHLGLDLQGGTYLILDVHVDEAVAADASQAAQRLQADLTSKGIAYSSITQPDPKNHPELISVRGVNVNGTTGFRAAEQTDVGANYDVRELGNGNYDLTMNAQAVASTKQRALTQTIETIGNRVNLLGVTEPTVQQHGLGSYEIMVQLPGITDQDRVKQVMQETAQLQFRLGKGGPFSSEADARANTAGCCRKIAKSFRARTSGAPRAPTEGRNGMWCRALRW